jgi:uncharacterized membrane protein required for colicin V production
MTMILPLLLVLILAVCVGFGYAEGIWTNLLRLVNIVTAGLLATNYYEPVARLLENQTPSGTYFWDFLSLWLVFIVALLLLRTATESVSRVKVKFLGIADRIGGGVTSLLAGWAMLCFIMMTLHTAPLAEKFLFEGFDYNKSMFLGIAAPDRQWLSFAQVLSGGSFSNGTQFDQGNRFLTTYAQRRKTLETNAASGSFLSDSAPKR